MNKENCALKLVDKIIRNQLIRVKFRIRTNLNIFLCSPKNRCRHLVPPCPLSCWYLRAYHRGKQPLINLATTKVKNECCWIWLHGMQTNNFHFALFFITHAAVNLPSMATYSTFCLTLSFPLQNSIFKCTKPVTTDLTFNVNIVKLQRLDTFFDVNL